jgi:hypothetical protein
VQQVVGATDANYPTGNLKAYLKCNAAAEVTTVDHCFVRLMTATEPTLDHILDLDIAWIAGSDSILIALTEERSVEVSVSRADDILIALTEERSIAGEVSAADSILIALGRSRN